MTQDTQTVREWADAFRKDNDKERAVPSDHKPTTNERNNLCYLAMKYVSGWNMRACDLAVVEMMGADHIGSLESLKSGYVPILADYMWDHLMGEPETPDSDDLTYAIEAVMDCLYCMDEATREAV